VTALHAFIASGRAVDAILLLVFVEAIVVLLLARRGRGPGAALLPTLIAGAALLLALRAALMQAPWTAVAAWLAAAGLAHGVDLALRLRR
jgi:hypothetical protein